MKIIITNNVKYIVDGKRQKKNAGGRDFDSISLFE